jgi:hypothetical protein
MLGVLCALNNFRGLDGSVQLFGLIFQDGENFLYS